MTVTKELIESDIAGMKSQLEEAKAKVNQIVGALVTLEGIKAYLEKVEPVEGEAISVDELAEIVAGPGATAEEPEALPAEIWEQSPPPVMVVDGNGKYVAKETV